MALCSSSSEAVASADNGVHDDALLEERAVERQGLVLAAFAAHVELVLVLLHDKATAQSQRAARVATRLLARRTSERKLDWSSAIVLPKCLRGVSPIDATLTRIASTPDSIMSSKSSSCSRRQRYPSDVKPRRAHL